MPMIDVTPTTAQRLERAEAEVHELTLNPKKYASVPGHRYRTVDDARADVERLRKQYDAEREQEDKEATDREQRVRERLEKNIAELAELDQQAAATRPKIDEAVEMMGEFFASIPGLTQFKTEHAVLRQIGDRATALIREIDPQAARMGTLSNDGEEAVTPFPNARRATSGRSAGHLTPEPLPPNVPHAALVARLIELLAPEPVPDTTRRVDTRTLRE